MTVSYNKRIDCIEVFDIIPTGNILIYLIHNSPVKKCIEIQYFSLSGYRDSIYRNVLNEKQVKYFKRLKL